MTSGLFAASMARRQWKWKVRRHLAIGMAWAASCIPGALAELNANEARSTDRQCTRTAPRTVARFGTPGHVLADGWISSTKNGLIVAGIEVDATDTSTPFEKELRAARVFT